MLRRLAVLAFFALALVAAGCGHEERTVAETEGIYLDVVTYQSPERTSVGIPA